MSTTLTDVFALKTAETEAFFSSVVPGFLFFLTPFCAAVLWFGIPFFWKGYVSAEMSSNAGGLIVWPAKLLIPVGFLLLTLQGISELIKRIGFLLGQVDASAFEKQQATPQEEIEAIAAANQLKLADVAPAANQSIKKEA